MKFTKMIFLHFLTKNYWRCLVFMPICYALLVMAFLSPAAAGNKKMMEKMGNNLIQLNNEVVKTIIDAQQSNANISFKAKIIQGNGQNRIVIEEAEIIPENKNSATHSTGPKNGNVPSSVAEGSTPGYKSYIDYQHLDIPKIDSASQVEANGRIATSQNIDLLMEQHPEARVIELHEDSINAIDWKNNPRPKKVFLLFW